MEITKNIDSAVSKAVLEYETCKRVAQMYLDKFPREFSYQITLTSSEDDSEGVCYFKLSDEEYSVLEAWKNLSEADELYGVNLDEYLALNGQESLRDRFLNVSSPYLLDIVDSCDLDEKLQFNCLGVNLFEKDAKTLKRESKIGVPLSDNEFCELLVAIMMDKNFTMNKLVYKNTDLAKKIFKHLSNAAYDYVLESPEPYIISFDEFADIADKILEPHKDLLGLFSSEDDAIISFANTYAHVPDFFEIYYESSDDKGKLFHIGVNFLGKNLEIFQEGIDDDMNYFDCDSFSINAEEVCKGLNVDSYEEIKRYLCEHYNSRTGLCDFRKWCNNIFAPLN